MQIQDLLFALGGISISVIGYFLKNALEEVKEVKDVAYRTKTKLEVMENDYVNKVAALNQKFDLLYNAINKLSDQIEELNKRMR